MLPFVVPAVQWAWSSRCGCDVLAAVRSTARPSGASTGARCSSPGVVQSRSPFRPPGLRPPLGRRSSAAARSSRPQVFAARGQSDSAQRGSRPRARVLKYLPVCSSLLESANGQTAVARKWLRVPSRSAGGAAARVPGRIIARVARCWRPASRCVATDAGKRTSPPPPPPPLNTHSPHADRST